MFSGIKKNSFKQIEEPASRTKLIKSLTRCHKKLHKRNTGFKKASIKQGSKVHGQKEKFQLNWESSITIK